MVSEPREVLFAVPQGLQFGLLIFYDQLDGSLYTGNSLINSGTPGTRTLKGNEKQFKLVGNLSYRGKLQWNFDQGIEKKFRSS